MRESTKAKSEKLEANSGERGFTLLLAALVASIVIALGSAIFSIAQKELTLSSIGRDSQYAFYAADTAAECALYWDSRKYAFPTTSAKLFTSNITCDGQTVSTSYVDEGDTVKTVFEFQPNGYCAYVEVLKRLIPEQNSIATAIRADGYSIGAESVAECESAIAESPRALQRSVELRY